MAPTRKEVDWAPPSELEMTTEWLALIGAAVILALATARSRFDLLEGLAAMVLVFAARAIALRHLGRRRASRALDRGHPYRDPSRCRTSAPSR